MKAISDQNLYYDFFSGGMLVNNPDLSDLYLATSVTRTEDRFTKQSKVLGVSIGIFHKDTHFTCVDRDPYWTTTRYRSLHISEMLEDEEKAKEELLVSLRGVSENDSEPRENRYKHKHKLIAPYFKRIGDIKEEKFLPKAIAFIPQYLYGGEDHVPSRWTASFPDEIYNLYNETRPAHLKDAFLPFNTFTLVNRAGFAPR